MASEEAHPAAMLASQDDASKGAGGGEMMGTEALSAGGGAGEMVFPKDGLKEEVQEWFTKYDGGVFKDFRKTFQRYGGYHVFGLSRTVLEKTLGPLDGEALYNAIHPHDRAATTGTAATERPSWEDLCKKLVRFIEDSSDSTENLDANLDSFVLQLKALLSSESLGSFWHLATRSLPDQPGVEVAEDDAASTNLSSEPERGERVAGDTPWPLNQNLAIPETKANFALLKHEEFEQLGLQLEAWTGETCDGGTGEDKKAIIDLLTKMLRCIQLWTAYAYSVGEGWPLEERWLQPLLTAWLSRIARCVHPCNIRVYDSRNVPMALASGGVFAAKGKSDLFLVIDNALRACFEFKWVLDKSRYFYQAVCETGGASCCAFNSWDVSVLDSVENQGRSLGILLTPFCLHRCVWRTSTRVCWDHAPVQLETGMVTTLLDTIQALYKSRRQGPLDSVGQLGQALPAPASAAGQLSVDVTPESSILLCSPVSKRTRSRVHCQETVGKPSDDRHSGAGGGDGGDGGGGSKMHGDSASKRDGGEQAGKQKGIISGAQGGGKGQSRKALVPLENMIDYHSQRCGPSGPTFPQFWASL